MQNYNPQLFILDSDKAAAVAEEDQPRDTHQLSDSVFDDWTRPEPSSVDAAQSHTEVPLSEVIHPSNGRVPTAGTPSVEKTDQDRVPNQETLQRASSPVVSHSLTRSHASSRSVGTEQTSENAKSQEVVRQRRRNPAREKRPADGLIYYLLR